MRSLRLVANDPAPLPLLAAAAAYSYPPAFLWVKPWFTPMFAVTMFSIGTVLDPGWRRRCGNRGELVLAC